MLHFIVYFSLAYSNSFMPATLPRLENIVRQAGEIALSHFNDLQNLEISQKSPRDFVTVADVAVEKFLKKELAHAYPEYGFWGEESGKTAFQDKRWIVDPIDGTHSFAKGQYFWSISVALEINDELIMGVVFAPALNDYYCAQKDKGAFKNSKKISVSNETNLGNSMISTGFACLRSYLEDNNLERFCRIAQKTTGQRRFGSAAMDMCLVADGQIDAFWEQELNLYDIAAGALILLEAGGTVTDFKGNNGIFPKQILGSNGGILKELLTLM
jgi:myo-inositol-1(or 4)-monophosphatase